MKFQDDPSGIIVRSHLGIILGKIRYHTRKKEYLYFPTGRDIYTANDLDMIAEELRKATKKRNEN